MNVSKTLGGVALGWWMVAALATGARADVKLPSFFNDNMVLQRDMQVPIWGTADPGEAIVVKLLHQTQQTTAGPDGKWKVLLDPLHVGRPFELVVVGKNTVTIHNILAGDVWIASGQSNMDIRLDRTANSVVEIAQANYPSIRSVNIAKKVALEPADDVYGKWKVCSPQTAIRFTAVGYFFARELYVNLNVPIGIIHTTWDGTPAEAWTSRAALEADPNFKLGLAWWDHRMQPELVAASKLRYDDRLAKWKAAAAVALAAGKPLPPKPHWPLSPLDPTRPANLFNGMINPLIPFAIKGVIWYQGESNARRGLAYRKLFPTLIEDWRSRWGEGSFPFYWVQLANYQTPQTEPVEVKTVGDNWALVREAQAMTLSLPNTGMATAIDLADADNPGNIHPTNKQEVGRRLGVVALANTYGLQLEDSGPVYDSMSIEGNKIHLHFKHAHGLTAQDGANPGPLRGFAIAGADLHWVWAYATIEPDDSVTVWGDKVAEPVAVRYDWASNPIGNLYNSAGLPAVPFRTDPDNN